MKYFFSTGEASGELAAVELAKAIRGYDPDAQFEGIGAARMREAGFTLWRDHKGWASLGPFDAIPRIPKLALAGMLTARHIAKTKPDLVVLVDFGAFHLRMAKVLRARFRYDGPILDWFPPAAWLDYEHTAREVASLAVPLPAFAHQYEYYKNLALPAVYFGHPLASRYTMRPSRPAPPPDGGRIALLPGSRSSEIRLHLPVLVEAFRLLRDRRPKLEATIGTAGLLRKNQRFLRGTVLPKGLVTVDGLQEAIKDVDAAFVASGTAVLETVLSGVPAIATYILPPLLARYARRVYHRKYITIPNLMMNRGVLPEILQERATPENLANAMDEVLKDPQQQYQQFAEIREILGPSDALDRSAKFAVALAQAGATP